MNALTPESIDGICDAYIEQIERYQRAVHTARSLAAAFSDGRDAAPDLKQLGQTLDEIAEINQRIQPFRRQERANGLAGSGRAQQLMHQLADAIQVLIHEIDAAEREARRARQRLVPELRQETLRQQMRAAYGRR